MKQRQRLHQIFLFVFIFPAKEYAIPITAKIAIISKVAPAGFEIKDANVCPVEELTTVVSKKINPTLNWKVRYQ